MDFITDCGYTKTSVALADVVWYGRVLHLGDCDAALLGQLLLGLLTGVGVTEVRVEVLIQDLRCLLIEVPPLPSLR